MAGRWRDNGPETVAGWMAGFSAPWWFAGGWALDLWLGHQTRDHSDIEIGCLSDDLPELVRHLSGWDIQLAMNKRLQSFLPDGPWPADHFSLWVRREAPLWDFEVLPEVHDGVRWLYRRDRRIGLPVKKLTTTTTDGKTIIAPEVQLLFKSKARRDKDEADFATCLPHLAQDQRRWLRAALALINPTNPWLASLCDE
jgi:hypothetical protein